MRIDKRLNLIVPIYDDETGKLVANVHSTPLSEETVERHFMLLAQTFSQVFSQGLGVASGPAVALRLLRRIADNSGTWIDAKTGEPGDGQILVEEIRRLTTVLVPGEIGQPWQQVPLQTAVERGFIGAEDRAEVENAIVFFIAASATLPRAQRKEMLTQAADLWGARLSSSSATDFAASLKTSTATANTGVKPLAPAIAPPAEAANAVVDGKPVSLPR